MRKSLATARAKLRLLKKRADQKGKKFPVRLQLCLQYLNWGISGTMKDRNRFVDLAKQWRREGRVGQKSTLLERKARKLFRKVNKWRALAASREGAKKFAKKAQRTGKKLGSLDPKYAERMAEVRREATRKRMEEGTGKAGNWWVFTPDGQKLRVRNLSKFCRENGLNRYALENTQRSPGNEEIAGGWSIERIPDDWV